MAPKKSKVKKPKVKRSVTQPAKSIIERTICSHPMLKRVQKDVRELKRKDDLGNLVINPPNMTGNVEKTMNYIVKKDGLWTIYLNVYKTMDFFGRVVVWFSDATSKLNYV